MKPNQKLYLQNRIKISDLPIKWKEMIYTTDSFYEYTQDVNFHKWDGDLEDDEKEAEIIMSQVNLTSGQSIIDIACGYGRISEILARKYKLDVMGIDISKGLIEVAKRNANEKQLSINYIHGDPVLSFPKKIFNAAIIVFNSFSLFSPFEAPVLLKNIYDHLFNEGVLFLDVDNKFYNCRYAKEDSKWYVEHNSLLLQEIYFHETISVEVCRDMYFSFEEDTVNEAIIYKKIYDLNELSKLAMSANFKIDEVYGDWELNKYDMNSPKIILKLLKEKK